MSKTELRVEYNKKIKELYAQYVLEQISYDEYRKRDETETEEYMRQSAKTQLASCSE